MTRPSNPQGPPDGEKDRMGDIATTVREMWSTRPERRPDDRMLAGVGAAIARRYALDPTLVRVVFAVSAIWGVGLVLYVVAWLVLPDAARPGRTPVLVAIVVVFLGFAVLGAVMSGSIETVVGLLVLAGLLLALHVHRADAGIAGAGAGAGPARTAVGVERTGPDGEEAAVTSVAAVRGTAPPEAARPRPPRVTAVTVALALIAAGTAGALGLLGRVPAGVTPVAGSALAVVALGLVVGAFLGAGRWLILAAVPLVLVLAAAAVVPGWTGDRVGGLPGVGRGSATIGDVAWAPQSAADVAPRYSTGLGSAQLDLRALTAPAPPVTTTAQTGAGDVFVLVPPTADVTVDCLTGAGTVRCLGGSGGGRVVDVGPDGPGGPQIVLHARSGAGDVEVFRA